MIALDNIDRVAAPSPDEFFHTYMRAGRPVVLTGLYDHTGLDELNSRDVVRRIVGDAPVEVRQPVTVELTNPSQRARPYTTTIAAFIDRQDAAESDDVVSESPVPAALARAIGPHPYAEARHPHDVKAMMFLAHRGHHTALHYDGDARGVLHTPILGAKRVTVIPESHGQRVNPRTDIANHSSFAPGEMAPDDYLQLLGYLGASDTVIQPGETIYIPALAWHSFQYLELSLAVSLKLGRAAHVRFLWDHVERLVPPEYRPLLADITDHVLYEPLDAAQRAEMVLLLSTFDAAYPYNPEAFGAFFDELVQVHRRLCPGRFVHMQTENDERRLGAPRRLEPPFIRIVWQPDSVPRFVEGLRPAVALRDRESRILFVQDQHVSDELRVEVGGSVLARLFGYLAGKDRMTVAQLAAAVECRVDQVLAVLHDLGRAVVCVARLEAHQEVAQVRASLRGVMSVLSDDPPSVAMARRSPSAPHRPD